MQERLWVDGCNHGEECYVGTTDCYDVYIFTEERHGQKVCIRYGDDGHQYISPGRLSDFYRASDMMPDYQQVRQLLDRVGQLKWERK